MGLGLGLGLGRGRGWGRGRVRVGVRAPGLAAERGDAGERRAIAWLGLA